MNLFLFIFFLFYFLFCFSFYFIFCFTFILGLDEGCDITSCVTITHVTVWSHDHVTQRRTKKVLKQMTSDSIAAVCWSYKMYIYFRVDVTNLRP